MFINDVLALHSSFSVSVYVTSNTTMFDPVLRIENYSGEVEL